MKIPSKEEIEKASTRFDNPDAMYGFEQGAEWMQQQLEDINVPQSAEVMTLEECKRLVADQLGYSSFSDMLHCTSLEGMFEQPQSFNMVAEKYASQFKAKSESLQAELDKRQWISVDHRLPENKQSALFFSDHGANARYRYSGYFFEGLFYYEGTDEPYALQDTITYWMPLPSIPTKEALQ